MLFQNITEGRDIIFVDTSVRNRLEMHGTTDGTEEIKFATLTQLIKIV